MSARRLARNHAALLQPHLVQLGAAFLPKGPSPVAFDVQYTNTAKPAVHDTPLGYACMAVCKTEQYGTRRRPCKLQHWACHQGRAHNVHAALYKTYAVRSCTSLFSRSDQRRQFPSNRRQLHVHVAAHNCIRHGCLSEGP